MTEADNGRLTAERAQRVLRALAGDLEPTVLAQAADPDIIRLHSHLAVVCDLLADHLEHDHASPPAPPEPAPG